jgi:DNA primase small subunit
MVEFKEMNFLKNEIREYYKKNNTDYPYLIEQREWGFGFDKKIDFRHKKFDNHKMLRTYLINNAPLYASYSIARYVAPEGKPMENKIMKGSDLVFDIDVHNCPNHEEKFVCDECLNEAKNEVIKLNENFLEPDLGIKKTEISVNFSGNRGYHVHVNNDAYKDLNKNARSELIDYIKGNDFDAREFVKKHPTDKSPAWFGRVGRNLKRKLVEKQIKTSKRSEYLNEIEKGIWENVSNSTWFYRELEKTINEMKCNVDEQVTTDVHRLIRLPDSIHGESMLLAKKVENIEKFEPLRDTIILSDEEIEIEKIKEIPEMRLGEKIFEKTNNKKIYVPKYYGGYLIAKGFAKLVN